MSDSDLQIFRSANLFLELHGDDAVTKARDMVRTLNKRGDKDGADRWLRIIVAIEAMRQTMAGALSQ